MKVWERKIERMEEKRNSESTRTEQLKLAGERDRDRDRDRERGIE